MLAICLFGVVPAKYRAQVDPLPQESTVQRFESDDNYKVRNSGNPIPCDCWHVSNAKTARRSKSDHNYKIATDRDARGPSL